TRAMAVTIQTWQKEETRYRSSIPTRATETSFAAAPALPVLLAKFMVTSLRTEQLSALPDTSMAPSTTTFRLSHRRNRPLLLRPQGYTRRVHPPPSPRL